MGISSKIVIIANFLFAVTCAPKAVFIPGARVIQSFNKCYSNDSMRVHIELNSTYQLITTRLIRLNKDDTRFLNKYRKSISSDELLFFAESTEHTVQKKIFLFYQPTEDYLKDFIERKLSDSVSYYYRTAKQGQTEFYETIIPQKKSSKSLVILSYPVQNIKNWFIEETDFIVQTISSGENYRGCNPENAFTLANDAFITQDSGNYLRPIIHLRQLRNNFKTDIEKNIYYQALSTYFSLSDQIDSADYYWSKIRGSFPNENIRTAHLPPTAEIIYKEAEKSQVIIFNEAHTQPKHRYLVGTMLSELYKQGFRFLALEALAGEDSINQRKYPIITSGFYLREPTMANLVRYALELGYTLIPYDSFEGNRERHQAQNIIDRTIKGDPNSKVIVLAGHSHINESSTENQKSMARFLYELSGINPLTINQTDLDGYSKSGIQEDAWLGNAFITRENPQANFMQNDFYIINNISITDRDNCFTSRDSKTVYLTIPSNQFLKCSQCAAFIYIWQTTPVKNPVPTQIQFLKNGKFQLRLCTGKYVVLVKDNIGETLWKEEVMIE
jgi:hypothetical protein